MARIVEVLRRLRDNPLAQEALSMDAEDIATVKRCVGGERPKAAPPAAPPPVKVTVPKTVRMGKRIVATDDF